MTKEEFEKFKQETIRKMEEAKRNRAELPRDKFTYQAGDLIIYPLKGREQEKKINDIFCKYVDK